MLCITMFIFSNRDYIINAVVNVGNGYTAVECKLILITLIPYSWLFLQVELFTNIIFMILTFKFAKVTRYKVLLDKYKCTCPVYSSCTVNWCDFFTIRTHNTSLGAKQPNVQRCWNI